MASRFTIPFMTTKEAEEEIVFQMKAGNVPFIQGSPGLAKSALMRRIAKKARLFLIDLRLIQMAQEDFNGLPFRDGNHSSYLPFDTFPLEGAKIPDGYTGWLIFMDEFNSGDRGQMGATYKLILDRMVNQSKLHERAFIVCAGNLETDNAIVTALPTPVRSRLVHIFIKSDAESFLEYIQEEKWDSRIISYLNYDHSAIHNFDPNSMEYTFECYRTWEFVNNRLKVQPDVIVPKLASVAACISVGAATDFVTYCEEFLKLPDYMDIIKNPETAKLPPEKPTRFACMSLILNKAQENHLDSIIKYGERFSKEQETIMYVMLTRANPNFRNHRGLTDRMVKLISYMHSV